MTPERWRRMQEIFLAATTCPRVERDAVLSAECGSDTEMRARLERMLEVDEAPASLLDHPPTVAPPPAPSRVGTRVGPYRVVRELGRGGMSTVWLAERTDVGKRVALKLLNVGPGGRENVRRFLLERRVLARLEHPNIAQLFDAGVTDDDTPYFAMEYVPGEPIDRYCDAHRLPIEGRLALFESVCAAVALAHSRGVVHRDLKPGNILVAERDALGGGDQVKLLDFGIAKALEDSWAHETMTRPDFRPMTPRYAAPEQLSGGVVTPASDVYALGILLYRLLCGHALRRTGAAQSQAAGAPHTPPPPSTMAGRSTTEAEGEVTPEAIAHARSITPAELSRVLGGGLDRITLTALAPAPEDRYPSATELLADVRRYRAGRAPRAGHSWAGRLARTPARAGAIVVLALILVVGFVVQRVWNRPVPVVRSGTVAVLPFDYSGPGDRRYLGDGIVSLLSSAFDAMDGLRAVEPRALLGFVARNGGAGAPAAASTVARRFGAPLYVTGDVVEAAGRLRIHAALRDTAGRVLGSASVDGRPDSLFALLDRVAAPLIVAMPGRSGGSLSRSAALSTRSLPALRAYLAGEEALRAGQYAVAVDAFQRAVAQDSDFALAYYRLSTAGTWAETDPDTVTSAAAHALRLAGRLNRFDSLRVVSWARYLDGDPAGALPGFRTIVQNRPDDIDAWFQLGETEYHWMPSLGYPASAARDAFEHVLALEPENTGALIHLLRIAALEGKRSELDTLTAKLLRLEPDSAHALEARVLETFSGGDAAERSTLIANLGHVGAAELQSAAASLVAAGVDPAGAARVAGVLANVGGTPIQREFGELLAAESLTAAGRLGEAAAALARLRPLSPQLAAEARAALALAPLTDPPRAELEESRQELARVPEVKTASILPISSFHVLPAPPVRLYLLGMLSHRLGDEAGARRYAHRLELLQGDATQTAFAHAYMTLIEASLLRSEGRPPDALRALGPARLRPDSLLPSLMRHPSAFEHWLRAELSRERGNDAEALRWYASIPDPTGYDIAYLPGSELRRAEILDQRGERAEAARHYRRFITLWQGADARLQPQVERARARLAELPGAARDTAPAGDPAAMGDSR